MESTFIEGVTSDNPIVKTIAVKALHYQSLAHMRWGSNSTIAQRARHKYDVLLELWNEIQEGPWDE